MSEFESNSGAVLRAAERKRTAEVMKSRKRPKSGRSFAMLIHAYWQSPQYAKLSPRAVKLLVDLTCQYRGGNNGDLTTAWSVMYRAGWRSKHALGLARQELEGRGWILRTRQGGIHSATLYALTFEPINDCRDKHGARKFDSGVAPTPHPLNLWRLPDYDKPPEPSKRRVRKNPPSPIAGKAFPDTRVNVLPIRAALSRYSGQS